MSLPDTSTEYVGLLADFCAAEGYHEAAATLRALATARDALTAEILALLNSGDASVVRACEGGGAEDIAMSLAITFAKVRDQRDAARAEVAALRKALEYYAKDHERPNDGPWGAYSEDFGNVARAALKGPPA